jgi:hypothetical protein
MSALQPKITSSGGSLNLALLADSDLIKATQSPRGPAGQRAWFRYEFAIAANDACRHTGTERSRRAAANMFGARPNPLRTWRPLMIQAFHKLVDIPNDGGRSTRSQAVPHPD